MTGQGPANPDDREIEINALLDGELDEAAAKALKAAAAEDGDLASAIVGAWQLQKNMDQLQLEKAPASLSRKLKRIPQEHKNASRRLVFALPRWVMAGSLAAVVLVAMAVMMNKPAGPAAPSSRQAAGSPENNAAQVEQTRRELAIAFSYLDKVGLRVGQEINQALNDELAEPIKDNLSKHMPYTGQSHKEKHV